MSTAYAAFGDGPRGVTCDAVDSVTAVLDWDPNDPDTVKVHYDLSSWDLEQRAELSAALADEEIAHAWGDDEIVVPEELEERVDELFARLEDELGPFPVPLAADEAAVEYGLDEWPQDDRETLTAALVDGAIAHRWEGTTLFVAAESEQTVDALLDAIEAGTLTAGAPAPENALSRLFAAADRLAKSADDRVGRDEVTDLVAVLDGTLPPYGVEKRTWAQIIDATSLLAQRANAAEPSSSDVIGAAQQLRSLVREFV